MMYLRLIVFAVFLSTVFSCGNSTQPQEEAKKVDFFFDVEGYFESEMERLNSLQPTVSKTAAINEKRETKTLEKVDFGKELKPFADSDINRLSWQEKYSTQRDTLDSGQIVLTHEALDESLRVRKIEVYQTKDVVTQVVIRKKMRNALAGSEQLLSYNPQSGYSIVNDQALMLSEGKKMAIEVSFQ